jgi:hypothetical protein
MAFGIVHKFKGGTKEQYDNAIATVHPPSGLPEGQTLHVAGETTDGDFVVVAIFEDEASWERFRDDTLLPGLASVEDSFTSPPHETQFTVHNLMGAKTPAATT